MSNSPMLRKLLPELKITVKDDKSHSQTSLEDGELSDEQTTVQISGISKNEMIANWVTTLDHPKLHTKKFGGFETGIDLSSSELIKKLDERAQRFGIHKEDRKQITKSEIDALYKSFGFDLDNLKSSTKNHRLEVIHVRGVSEMSSKEVLAYFNDYGPARIEWINDISCNICWYDETTAARALIGMSQPLDIHRKSSQNESDGFDGTWRDLVEICKTVSETACSKEDMGEKIKCSLLEFQAKGKKDPDEDKTKLKLDSLMEVDESDNEEDPKNPNSSNLDVPIPPGHWRLGVPNLKAKALLLRFATRDDKKLPGAEKRSQYYKKFGNPNYGGLTGLISTSRKRKFQASRTRQIVENYSLAKKDSPPSPDYTKRSKVPRMKMYADAEEDKRKTRAIKRLPDDKPSIKTRLGVRYTRDDLYHLGQEISSNDEDVNDDVLSVTCKIPSRYDIWTDQAKAMAAEDPDFQKNTRRYGYNAKRAFPEKQFRKSRPAETITRSPDRKRYSAFRSERATYEYNRQYGYTDYSGDLREALNITSNKRDVAKEDLRSRIQMTKKSNKSRKHRSILCIDSEDNDEEDDDSNDDF